MSVERLAEGPGQIEDPYGHPWWVATHKEDVPPDEMETRVKQMFAAPGGR